MDPIRFRDCACPETPHAEGDTVSLRPRLPFESNVKALKLILGSEDGISASAAWPVYLFDGPEDWNLLDSQGKPLPLTRAALEALPWEDQYEIADRADDLYGGQVLAPLVRRMKASSKPSPTRATSRRRPSS